MTQCDRPFCSVIVPAGRLDRVAATVDTLLGQSYPRKLYEILVVTPEPERLAALGSRGVQVVAVGRLLPPGAMRNQGAAAARGDILFFLDDDCLAPTSWIEDMVHVLSRPGREGIGAVGCRVVAETATFWNLAADHALFTSYQSTRCGLVDGLGSAALAMRGAAFMAVGGFDAELLASEDWDFSLKLQRAGYRCWFEPSIEVRHDHRRGGFSLIQGAAYRSGYFSGLTVQRRHAAQVSRLARLMQRVGSPWLYWLPALPYALALTLLWAWEMRRSPSALFRFFPWVLLARCTYQFGVWKRLWGCRQQVFIGKDSR